MEVLGSVFFFSGTQNGGYFLNTFCSKYLNTYSEYNYERIKEKRF